MSNTEKSPPIKITVDDRERNCGTIKALMDNGAEVKISRLKLGDYIADNRLLFERKTLSDFAISIIDRRIFKQAWMMVNSNYNPVLILEGGSNDLKKCKVNRDAIQGALIYISVILKIPVLRAINCEETAKLIIYTAKQYTNLTEDCPSRGGYRPKTKKKRQLYILQGLPGIGKIRAQALLERFGSVEAAIRADIEDLAKTANIGKNTAVSINNAVKEVSVNYGKDWFSEI